MTKDQFNFKLKKLDLTLNDFSKISGISYSTINNWGFMKDNGKAIAVPDWVDSFLVYFEKAKKYDYLKNEIYDVMKELENK
ncbi:helix-turn-helix domain-containing protein [Poseidonibacter ostreae]|uniref:XRE family transcriptional regulator n=1 Tax=Poseidonibacter ostreae TaxID=2654171 RepID=A0A6L4WN85_9BACT|nr:helix-turn-helix transcriptional regulator [Poseidonibacter ostreae]KAB7881232.1 hypothetical protein GA417_14185 [Poseidonibacter ostreae]KAB7884279.1 hypothetical protein GBG19_16020 [Poseidonibacter ostreae]KAB7886494.1 hypothetical protein GBG18_14570 [Poseidonibacter ostreae]